MRSTAELNELRSTVLRLTKRPNFSVIMPVFNPPLSFLKSAIASVENQIYPEWELCIADDCSTDPEVREFLQATAELNERVKLTFRDENGHISRATNSAIELASGDYLAFLDQDDTLTPDALYEFASLINDHPDADLIYSDEDKLDENGHPVSPYFKAEWSPDNLLTRMYTLHLSVYRRDIVTEMGGLRPGFEGSQDHDLALRFVERTAAIYHIPKVLYNWRMHAASAASSAKAKDYASESGRRAVQEAILRREEPGTVENVPDQDGIYQVRYSLKQSSLLSIIIPTRDLEQSLRICLDSVFKKSTYQNFEVLQIDNQSKSPRTLALFEEWLLREPNRYRTITCDMPFNFARLNNIAAAEARGEFLLFLNNDTEVITPDWLEWMLGQAQRSSIGAVGAKLLYPDNTVQHAGLILGLGDLQTAGHIFRGYADSDGGYFGNLRAATNYSAVTAACLMCKKNDFDRVGGFDEDFAVAYNDVDLCLKFRNTGLNNICIPQAKLYHHESKSRGYEDTESKRARLREEAAMLHSKWHRYLIKDPYYNPNLSKRSSDFRINLES